MKINHRSRMEVEHLMQKTVKSRRSRMEVEHLTQRMVRSHRSRMEAEHLMQKVVCQGLWSRHQTSCRRRCRQFICKPRAHRAGHGRGRFPGRIQAAGLSYGKSPGRSSDQKRCEMDLHQPCWGFSARRSKNWKIYSGRGGIGPKCQRGKRYQLCRLCDCCGR